MLLARPGCQLAPGKTSLVSNRRLEQATTLACDFPQRSLGSPSGGLFRRARWCQASRGRLPLVAKSDPAGSANHLTTAAQVAVAYLTFGTQAETLAKIEVELQGDLLKQSSFVCWSDRQAHGGYAAALDDDVAIHKGRQCRFDGYASPSEGLAKASPTLHAHGMTVELAERIVPLGNRVDDTCRWLDPAPCSIELVADVARRRVISQVR